MARFLDHVLLVEVVDTRVGPLEPLMNENAQPVDGCTAELVVPSLALDVLVIDRLAGERTVAEETTIFIAPDTIDAFMFPVAMYHEDHGLGFAWEDSRRSPFEKGEHLLVFTREDADGRLVTGVPNILGVYGDNRVHGLDGHGHGHGHGEGLALQLGPCTRAIPLDSDRLDTVATVLRDLRDEGRQLGIQRDMEYPPRLGSICYSPQ